LDVIAGSGAFVIAVAGSEHAETEAVPALEHEAVGAHLRVDGFGEALREGQAEQVGGKIIDREHAAEVVRQLLPRIHPQFLAALVLPGSGIALAVDNTEVVGLKAIGIPDSAQVAGLRGTALAVESGAERGIGIAAQHPVEAVAEDETACVRGADL